MLCPCVHQSQATRRWLYDLQSWLRHTLSKRSTPTPPQQPRIKIHEAPPPIDVPTSRLLKPWRCVQFMRKSSPIAVAQQPAQEPPASRPEEARPAWAAKAPPLGSSPLGRGLLDIQVQTVKDPALRGAQGSEVTPGL